MQAERLDGFPVLLRPRTEKEGTLFYGTKNGLLFALDAKTGTTKWEHKIGVGIINTVVPIGSDQVLAADFDGKVTLVGAEH